MYEKGEHVVFEVSGPLTILNVLIDPKYVFKGMRKKPELMARIFAKLGKEILAYMKLAKEQGADFISYADSSGGVNILGPKMAEQMVNLFTYDFVKLDDIYECLTPALNKYGVDFDILSERPTQVDEQGNSVFLKEMGALWRYEADLELCWTNADRPGDKVRSFLHVIGTNEAPDKAKGAAWTYGLKYYFLNKFNIMQASGIDDPDMRGTEKEEMPKQEASVKPEKPKKKQEKTERKETAAKQEQTEPVREKKTDRKKLRDGNAISEGTVKVEYAVTDTEENLPGQMTFGMEESESGLEEFSDEETKAEDPVQTEEISVDEEITAETDADGFRAVEETDEVPFDEDDEISFDAEEEEETPEETAEEVLEDMAHEEDAEDEVKWAEKVICNFGVYAGTPLGEMMQDARGYQTIKWLVQRYKGQNQEIQKAAKILLDHEKEMQKAA